MTDYNIINDIDIDYYNLKSECITMASTYYKYADMAREAKRIVSEKERSVKIVRAERSIKIREENRDKKLTVDLVNAMVECDSEVCKAEQEVLDAEATYDKINVMVKSLETKKAELDNLVKLNCNSNYVENQSKTTRDLNAETSSEYLRNSMHKVPTQS